MDKISSADLVTAIGGQVIAGTTDFTIDAVTIDSRQVPPGALFVAIKGERFDGHDFIGDAVRVGARAVVVHEERPIETDCVTVIRVPDTLAALGDIARFYRSQFKIPVVGITGSNGKTTIKDLLSSVLEQQFSIVKTEGNYNNEIGLPLTLFKLSRDTEAAVVEMGMRGLGQIRRLTQIARPTMGIVANVGLTHLELLGSQENIAAAKGELIESLPADGLAVLNGDDPFVRMMYQKTAAPSVFYGIEGPDLDVRAVDIRMVDQGSRFRVETKGTSFDITLPVPGRHNILNALAAMAAALEMGVTVEAVQKGLAKPQLTGKRLKIYETRGYWIIDDTYNASPSSVTAALDVLADTAMGQRKIAVLADMLELGPNSRQIHRELGEYARKKGVDHLYAFGDLGWEYVDGFGESGNRAGFFDTKAELISQLQAMIQPGDVVLVKGSRGMKMEEVVAALTEEEAN